MAYITRKKIKGITYYYAEERERRDGKSRRKWQKYLGPLHKIIEASGGKFRKTEICGDISTWRTISLFKYS
jgi:hypothetical protein